MHNLRIGNGYDVHRLVDGRKLILGGIDIPHSKGLLGHSDADVLVHAILDSIIGALGLGDIGRHFPDTDEKYSGISSLLLLEKIADLVSEKSAKILNLDSIIVAQKPKLLPYIDQMRVNIANALGIDVSCVNIKATTEEHLGFTGKEEGISSYAVCLISL